MIPTRLEDWNLAAIADLLTRGYYELETFDFKEALPHSKDNRGKERLEKSCCAFANSAGGFLIFGVKNCRSLPVAERLVGVDPAIEFFEQFGNFPAHCVPSVRWAPRQPSIRLDNGKFVHVVQIPQSWNGPHCVEDTGTAKHFMKRTNKGDEAMSYEEVRIGFLQYYEKRLKLQLLRAELQGIRRMAPAFILSEEPSFAFPDTGELGLAVLESVLADTYTILAEKPRLVEMLSEIRQLCRRVNSRAQRFYRTHPDWPRGADRNVAAIKEYNVWARNWANEIDRYCDEAIRLLAEIINS